MKHKKTFDDVNKEWLDLDNTKIINSKIGTIRSPSLYIRKYNLQLPFLVLRKKDLAKIDFVCIVDSKQRNFPSNTRKIERNYWKMWL
jgi:hypothetical protein